EKTKMKNVPVKSEEVVDGKLEPFFSEALNRDSSKENEPEEKKISHRNNNFEEPLDDLVKALEIKPKNVSALEKDENKVKNAAKDQELIYLRTKRKHLPILT
ncbi:42098_t:CDS:2, partial [Gigaspora margarita]